MFRQFVAFTCQFQCTLDQVNTVFVLGYLEFLFKNGFSFANMANHLSAIRANYILHGLDTSPFRDDRITLFLKSVKINAKFAPVNMPIFDTDTLALIVSFSEKIRNPTVFRSLYLFCFYSFLRLSNILPHAMKDFDPTRHLTRGDLIFSQNSCIVIIKWSETIQDRKSTKTITIPALGASPLCPIEGLKRMFSAIPASKNQPLFSIWSNNRIVPLTDSMARKHLKKVCSALNIQPPLTFHSFRRAGTTWAFNRGVSVQDLMLHGTWSSDAIWRYIKSTASTSTPVSTAFQRTLTS